MTLRQSLLAFKAGSSPVPPTVTPPNRREDIEHPESSSKASEIDGDMIVVDLSDPPISLPTPSESATDVSSETSQIISLKEVSKGHPKRVKRVIKSRSQDCLLENVESGQSRSVSGETLVTSTSHSSLVQSGITALNLPWSMSSVFHGGDKGEMLLGEKSVSVGSQDTMNDEEEQARLERLAAKRAKMEENARLREVKQKEADEKATRRSSRASMLGKAGDLMSGLATSVLGKRPREVYDKGMDRLEELKNNIRPRSMIEPLPASTPAFEGPTSKKRRLSEGDLTRSASATASLPSNRKSFAKRDKRWLVSGLYAGQTRSFDGRLTESKNKRKQSSKEPDANKENTVLPLPMFAGDRLLQQGRDFKLPFDVFSPLPAGQPKPDEWRKTNKNVFVGDASQEWRETRFQEHSTCMCQAETGCDSDCMNRFMYYECDDRNCNLTEEQCGNRSFEGLRQRSKKGGKYNVGVEVIKTVDRGYGVRSNRTFEPNQIIVEYTGEIITQDECEHRMRTIYKDNECYYLMLFDQNMIIDATRGSIARFVNHSCEPNCRMEKWTVGGKPRMALFAGDKGIMTGDELTYDYNFDPYSQKNVQACRCGAKNCRGVLGPKSKEERKAKLDGEESTSSRPASRLAGAKRKIGEIIDERLTKKKKVTVVMAKVYASPTKKNSPANITKRRIASVEKKSKNVTADVGLSRKPSKLKRMIASAKDRSMSKRVVSTSSASQALLAKDVEEVVKGGKLSRTESVRAKASTLRKNVVRTVRGGQKGQERSLRVVAGDVGQDEE